MAQFQPILPQKGIKTADLVARQIRSAILKGELSENDLLPAEPYLLTAFKVSRPTLREALRLLESEGLVTVLRGARGGARIKQPTAMSVARSAGFALQAQGGTLFEVYEARRVIEPPAARLAAENQPEEAAAALQAQIDREHEIVRLGQWRAVPLAVADFHQVLLEHCGNRALTLMGLSLKQIVDRHQQLLASSRRGEDKTLRDQRVRLGFRSHQRLVDLIRTGQGALAERHWRLHMLGARDFWLVGLAAHAVVDGIE